MERKRLGQLLYDRRNISKADLENAVEQQSHKNSLLGEILLSQGKVKKAELIAALQEVTRTPYVNCESLIPEPAALTLLAHPIAAKYCALPVALEKHTLQIVMAEPQNLIVLDELRFLTGYTLRPLLGFRQEILPAIERAYANTPQEQQWLSILDKDDEEIEFISTSTKESTQAAMREFQAELRGAKTPAVGLVSSIIRMAVNKKASDIHIEQSVNDATVRIRVDGVLREVLKVPAEMRMQLISRIKILSDMDIAERRVSQDGRFLATIGGKQVDMRVSTLPTQYGEKVVMRLLDASAAAVPFEKLGLGELQSAELYKLLGSPQGMILVTGPTGSGKSTTLYSALNYLKSPRVNITTIEDPVEYVIDGVNQVQVNVKAGRTFASCLRSMLRQDPNIVMVGEIRDGETAEIALTAAQTGHLVLSTLHTNDAVSAITRLVDLGVPSFLISSSVTAVIAQRLVRKLCHCRVEMTATSEYQFRMRSLGADKIGDKMFVPVGCKDCEELGFKGRLGIYELLVLNDDLRAAVRDNPRDTELRTLALKSGMKLMSEDALRKVAMGITTLDEVLRVVPIEPARAHVSADCEHVSGPGFTFCPRCGIRMTPGITGAELGLHAV
jgi:type IV pilus assembly protein PilB